MDIHFCMLFKGLGLVKEASLLLFLHLNCGITTAIYDPNSITVCLSIVCYKSLKFGLRDIMLCHNSIKILLEDTLSNDIF